MMKTFVRIKLAASVLLMACLAVCTGCDLIRASLGKPTSKDLALLRARRDAIEKAERDSIAAEKAAREAEAARLAAEKAAADSLLNSKPKRYYAVAGAFKEDSGAQVYVEKLRDNGFKVRIFDFKSGLKVVCVDGSDDLSVVREDMARLKKLKLAPTDPWIYNTNQKLHKEI
ncbi:MAG: hypothetical protein K6G79_07160 [Bacteroidales bacterium]|nr:hypothetical protein [Bacteroidales bacterium]